MSSFMPPAPSIEPRATESMSQSVSAKGLRGLRGLEHIGIVVPDLREATSFFATVLGWEVAFTAGPFADPGGDGMETNFDLHREAKVHELAVVRSPLVNLELFEGTAPDQRTEWPRLLDIGGLHLTVYVDEIDAALQYLVDYGCESLGGLKPLGGPESGQGARFGHVRTPFGLYLELITYPFGRDYEKNAATLAFNPAAPDALARRAAHTDLLLR